MKTASPTATPELESLIAATTNVVAFRIDGQFHSNSGDNLVNLISAEMDKNEQVFVSETEDFNITLGDLLDAEIINDDGALKLSDGRVVGILIEQRARFTSAVRVPCAADASW